MGLPRYKCHKEVQAVKLQAVRRYSMGLADLVPLDKTLMPITVSEKWVTRHHPEPGGYYVVYDDGYDSYSPAQAFEEGYTRIDG